MGSIPAGGAILGRLAEWLSQQFAKLSFRNGRTGSNPVPSASYSNCLTYITTAYIILRYSPIAQLVERRTVNPSVPGSSPGR